MSVVEKILERIVVQLPPKPPSKSPVAGIKPNTLNQKEMEEYNKLKEEYNKQKQDFDRALKLFRATLDETNNPLDKDLADIVYTKGGGVYYLVKWDVQNNPGHFYVSWQPESEIQKESIDIFERQSNTKSIPSGLLIDESSRDSAISLISEAEVHLPNYSDVDVKTLPPPNQSIIDIFQKSENVTKEGDVLKTILGEIKLITPTYVLELVEDDEFVSHVIQNLQALYGKKRERYVDLYNKAFDSSNTDKSSQKGEKENDEQQFSIKQYLQQMFELANQKLSNPVKIEDMRMRIRDAITNKKNGILSLTGDARKNIRDFLANQIYVLSRSMAPFNENFLNIALMGPAGTGKSKLASVIAYVYGKIGILLKDYPKNIIVGSAKDVVASFSGQTVNKTNKFLGMGLESVIFLDEAYSIMACNPKEELMSEQGYGPEAITEIVSFLDLYRGLAVLVVAGYEKAMQNCFFSANQGLQRRFPFQYILQSYTSDDLTAQFLNVVNDRFNESMFRDRETLSVVKYIMEQLNSKGLFPNQAGDVANLAAIFASVIESYPGYQWNQSTNINIFMLSQVYNLYSKQKNLNKQTTQPNKQTKNIMKKLADKIAGAAGREVVSQFNRVPDNLLSDTENERPKFRRLRHLPVSSDTDD